MALPRSGCSTTRPNGSEGDQSRIHEIPQAPRGLAPLGEPARQHQNDGELRELGRLPQPMPPMVIHDLLPAAVPAPVPNSNVNSSTNTAVPYTYGAAHSRSRGESRKTRTRR